MSSLMICIPHPKFAIDIIQKITWLGRVGRMGQGTVVQWVLVGNTGVKTPLWGSRRKWEDNINTDIQEVGCSGMDCIELAEDT